MAIDRKLITRKLVLITADLRALGLPAGRAPEEYLASPADEVVAERYLERIIGGMIDIDYHLITESGQPPPRDCFESFTQLGRTRGFACCVRCKARCERGPTQPPGGRVRRDGSGEDLCRVAGGGARRAGVFAAVCRAPEEACPQVKCRRRAMRSVARRPRAVRRIRPLPPGVDGVRERETGGEFRGVAILRRRVVLKVVLEVALTLFLIAAQAGVGLARPEAALVRPAELAKGVLAQRGREEPSLRGASPAAAACRMLGVAAMPAVAILSLGTFRPDDWVSDRGYCRALLVEGTMALGSVGVREIGHPRRPALFGAGDFDRFFRDALRSRSRVDNFFEGGLGSLWAPLFVSGGLFAAGSVAGRSSGYREHVARALPLLWLGIGGNSLPTEVFKKGFGRKRPFLRFGNDRAIAAFGIDDDARESFYSGHASTAFFTAAFADPVIAEIVRIRRPRYGIGPEAPATLRLLRLLQGAVFYGLAAGVAYSRMDLDKHYMSDVVAGGLAGFAHGRLLYHFGYAGGEERRRRVAVGPLPGARGIEVTWDF